MSLINRVFPSIAQEFNRAFSLLEDPLFNTALRSSTRFPSSFTSTEYFRPSVDICETDKSYMVEAEVPGMKKDDLSVEFTNDNTLVLKGKIEKFTQRGDNNIRTVEATPDTAGGATPGKATDESATEGSTTTVVQQQTTGEVSERSPVYWSSERVLGNFQRSFQFPGRIDPENVKANYKDGILSIIVPKVDRHGTKINIE
ncbi:hypothetical protein Glove_292g46 [Diversispora epigaea]|uniref:SHSP domain-containing protein n=1 Tax=Diversispora epigaea TaxID=1348612 RepID=A0A397I678_9GLOM|nr:hypothetical protein Glove_292g46 [Diversispora epigaea]